VREGRAAPAARWCGKGETGPPARRCWEGRDNDKSHVAGRDVALVVGAECDARV